MAQGLDHSNPPLNIAVVGAGISGLSAAWLLSESHHVTVFETDNRAGGHSHTVEVNGFNGKVPVDTGFIVYNERTYPNLTALFNLLDVPTHESTMSFSVSCEDGAFEYSGGSLRGLLGQKSNLLRPRFWSMLSGIRRFYRDAPGDIERLEQSGISLGDYLTEQGYSRTFQEDHLLPMAAAIWSAPCDALRAHPAASFLRFCVNHGLLQLNDRPTWRSVIGGSREYVRRLSVKFADRLQINRGVIAIQRSSGTKVQLRLSDGTAEEFDHVVIAAHADQALAMLEHPSPDEARLLGAFRYEKNIAVLHSDRALMPHRQAVWSAWNYMTERDRGHMRLSVTYWMNQLQAINGTIPYFVTLNPTRMPKPYLAHKTETYEHPIFDAAAMAAQKSLWSLQGKQRTWFCGAYFGAGFHEDGLQAGLAVAEQLGGVRRPWVVHDESGRIHLETSPRFALEERAA